MEFEWNVNEVVHSVSFCEEEAHKDILAYAVANKIVIARASLPLNDPSKGACHELAVFYSAHRIDAMTFAPGIKCDDSGNLLAARIFAAGSDFNVYEFILGTTEVKCYKGHTDYVNDLCVHPLPGLTHFVASTSDDNTCLIWDTTGDSQYPLASIELSSPGVSVQWHRLDPEHIMIAEQSGLIRLVLWRTMAPFITLNAGLSPLSSAHWNPTDHMRFGAVADRKWLLWNLSPGGVRVLFPESAGEVHAEGGKHFRWSSKDTDLFATSSTRNLLKITDAQRSHVSRPFLQRNRLGAFSWQRNSPWIVLTADCFLKFVSL